MRWSKTYLYDLAEKIIGRNQIHTGLSAIQRQKQDRYSGASCNFEIQVYTNIILLYQCASLVDARYIYLTF